MDRFGNHRSGAIEGNQEQRLAGHARSSRARACAKARQLKIADLNTLELIPWRIGQLIDPWRWVLTGSKVSGSIEVFASGWPPRSPGAIVGPGRHRHNLDNLVSAASVGDVVALAKLLGERKYSQEQLNRALAFVLNSRRDNTAAINFLTKARRRCKRKLRRGEDPSDARHGTLFLQQPRIACAWCLR